MSGDDSSVNDSFAEDDDSYSSESSRSSVFSDGSTVHPEAEMTSMVLTSTTEDEMSDGCGGVKDGFLRLDTDEETPSVNYVRTAADDGRLSVPPLPDYLTLDGFEWYQDYTDVILTAMPQFTRNLFFTGKITETVVESEMDDYRDVDVIINERSNRNDPLALGLTRPVFVSDTMSLAVHWGIVGNERTLFGFESTTDERTIEMLRLANWYTSSNGNLSFRKTVLRMSDRMFTLNASMAMLRDVPDDNILRNRSFLLLRALMILIQKYKRECYEVNYYSPVPNLTLFPRVGRLWMMLRTDLFYRNLLRKLIDMPHVHLELERGSRFNPCWRTLVNTTHTVLLILLTRVSRDMFNDTFVDLLSNGDERDVMRVAFDRAMSDRHRYGILAVVFSLFVDRRVVVEAVRRHKPPRCKTPSLSTSLGIWYMCRLRDIPYRRRRHEYKHYDSNYRALFARGTSFAELFDSSLAARSLLSVVRQYGLSFALNWIRRYNLPNTRKLLHLYFLRAIWILLVIYHLESLKLKRAQTKDKNYRDYKNRRKFRSRRREVQFERRQFRHNRGRFCDLDSSESDSVVVSQIRRRYPDPDPGAMTSSDSDW